MDRSYLHRLAPTLAALALPFAACAATATERDHHFESIRILIEKEYRLPAQRQIDDWRKSAYPDDGGWFQKYLDWAYANRFRVSSPDAAEKAKLDTLAKSLGAEIEAAGKAGKLPETLRKFTEGTGQVLRLVNDILNIIDPDSPPPLLKAQAFSDEQKLAANAAVKALAELATKEFAAGVAAVAAHKTDEDKFWELPDTDPRFAKINEKAITLRLDAIKAVYFAHMALREVADRGQDFGIDPAPAQAWLKDFITKNFDLIQDWDYNWGENHAFLHAYNLTLICEGVRFKVKKAAFEDTEAELFKTLDMKLEEEFKDHATREGVRTLQAQTWATALNWYRDMGSDKMLERGAEIWAEFLRRQKEAKAGALRLDDRDDTRAIAVARIYFAAAKLMLAKGDKAAAIGIYQQVASKKDNPLSVRGQQWVTDATRQGGSSGGSDWGAQPTAEDPEMALGTGKAFLATAQNTGDPAQARSFRINAAVSLRNGVLGLSNPAYADKADQYAPEVWYQYARCLNQLELRWHAAVAAYQGVRHLQRRVAELKTNPWKARDGSWTDTGKYVSALANNAITYGGTLSRFSKGSGTTQLNDDIITSVGKISPDLVGPTLEKILIYGRIEEADYAGAIETTQTFLKKYKDLYIDGAQMLIQCYQRQIGDKQVSDTDKKSASEAVLKFSAEVLARVKAELPKAKDDAKRSWLSLAAAADSAQIPIWMAQGKFAEVLAKLDAEFWKNPPSDEDLSARLMRSMCTALKEWYGQQIKDPKNQVDSALLVANWPRVAAAYDMWKTQRARMPAQEDSLVKSAQSIAFVFRTLDVQINAMRQQPGAPAALAEIANVSRRAFADLVEPVTGDSSKPDNVLGIASVLWDLGEHQRAARLYAIYLKQTENDPEAATLWSAPKGLLDPLEGPLGGRPELKKQWQSARDLLEDAPDLAQRLIGGLDPDQAGERKRDFARAVEALRVLRAEAAKQKSVLGAAYAQVDAGLAKLDELAVRQVRRLGAMTNLAQCARELGDKAKANALYQQLITYDPLNLTYITATVELTLDRVKAGEQVAKDEAERAQQLAVKVRDGASPNERDVYWTAVIQILELSAHLGDTAVIVKRLKFDATNGSTPADELCLLPRPKLDDKRVRRAKNILSRQLCERYLALFAHVKDAAKPSFRIDDCTIDGKQGWIFVPVDAPKFVVLKKLDDGGLNLSYVWEEGKPPPADQPKPPADEVKPPVEPKKEAK